MKLTFRSYPLQLRHVFTVAGFSRTHTPDVQVAIEHDGLIGYGEASMPPYLGETVDSVIAFLQDVDLSRFAGSESIEEILTYVDAIAPGNTAAKASVDIALHDLYGKMQGEPWHRIWGLDKEQTPFTTYTIGIDTPEMVRRKTQEVAGQFKILKVKMGVEGDRDLIRSIREVSDLPIAVDANQGWKDKQQALDTIHWLHELGAVMVEQPLPKEQLDDMAWLTARSPLPTFADESLQRLSDIAGLKDVFTGINIKLMKCTGMHEAHKMARLAQELGMKVMIGCMTETTCAISAAAQLAPLADFADLDGNLLIANDCFRQGMKIVDGKITLNDLPGIGVVP